MTDQLNQQALALVERLINTDAFVSVETVACGTRLVDCSSGRLATGLALAEICLAGLAEVAIEPSSPWPLVTVRTDQPLAACMASQYAGWQVSCDDFFAMGSGPMRAAAGKETLFEKIGLGQESEVAVGVLETRQQPSDEVCRRLADDCRVKPERLTLLWAPTASQPGTLQVVARSVETALHKLHELGFDLNQVESGYGFAPLAPVAGDDLSAIGRTNDAVLYGGQVTLWVDADDSSLKQIVAEVPSSASKDHGQPFADIFRRYDGDFYKIDPHLFSPAVVTLVNVASGRVHRAGRLESEVLERSFASG